jgi:hypothetical protein
MSPLADLNSIRIGVLDAASYIVFKGERVLVKLAAHPREFLSNPTYAGRRTIRMVYRLVQDHAHGGAAR